MAVAVKTYKKIIVSGNVLEIYEAEKEPTLPERNLDPDDGFKALDILLDPDEIRDRNMTLHEALERDRGDRKLERRQQTVRDARNITRRLALANFKSGDKFLTLTFDPKRLDEESLRDVKLTDKLFKNFIKRFNYKFDTKLKYIAVREFHKSGRLHYHMICDWDKTLMFEDEIRENERMLGVEVWKHGFVDIKQLDHVDNVGAYIIKYMTKNVALEFFKGCKIYLNSKGLERPIVYRGLEAEAIIEAYNLRHKKEVFTNSYTSEYQGNIVYKEYNLSRLN